MTTNNSSFRSDYPTLNGIPVSIRNDYLFKKIFGSQDSKSAVAHLIHLVTGIAKDSVESLEIGNTNLETTQCTDKRGIVDIYIRLKDGRRINIEMQNHWQDFYPRRALYYWALMYVSTGRRGEEYTSLKQCIGIHFINDTFKPADKLHSVYTIREEQSHTKLDDALLLHFFDLSKLSADDLEDLQGEVSELERWLLFIKTDRQDVRNILAKGDELMTDCNKKVESVFFDLNEREKYIREHIAEMDYISAMSENFESGKAVGLEEGIMQGKLQGQKSASLSIAKTLLQNGVDKDLIQKATGLTREQLEKI